MILSQTVLPGHVQASRSGRTVTTYVLEGRPGTLTVAVSQDAAIQLVPGPDAGGRSSFADTASGIAMAN